MLQRCYDPTLIQRFFVVVVLQSPERVIFKDLKSQTNKHKIAPA